MLNYIFQTTAGLLPTLLIVAVLVFLFVHMLPGDPARLAAGRDADEATVQLVRQSWGWTSHRQSSSCISSRAWCKATSGTSMRTRRPVAVGIGEALYAPPAAHHLQHGLVGGVWHGDRHHLGRVPQSVAPTVWG